ncbi:MAG: hypothetical protein GY798_22700 [Hyphomicrobiales bacterium]|nr:hypothetical protein [Hyphomicrobiales bacterium]
MAIDLDELVTHDPSDHCVVCHAQDIVSLTLIPAAAAWEATAGLPRFSTALHGAAGLIGSMMAEGVPRADAEAALSGLLDEIEKQIAEEGALAGPAQGTA